jgi:flagellin-specific chaperone FliS
MGTSGILENEVIKKCCLSSRMSAYDDAKENLKFLKEAIEMNDRARERQYLDRLIASIRRLMSMEMSDDIYELYSYMIDRLTIKHSALCIEPAVEVGWLLDSLKSVSSLSAKNRH